VSFFFLIFFFFFFVFSKGKMIRRLLSTRARRPATAAAAAPPTPPPKPTAQSDELRPLGAVYRFSRAHLPAHMSDDDVSRITSRPLIVFPNNHQHHRHEPPKSPDDAVDDPFQAKMLADNVAYKDVRARESSS
jgi:hypothetical protein